MIHSVIHYTSNSLKYQSVSHSHNLKVVGSNPTPATKLPSDPKGVLWKAAAILHGNQLATAQLDLSTYPQRRAGQSSLSNFHGSTFKVSAHAVDPAVIGPALLVSAAARSRRMRWCF